MKHFLIILFLLQQLFVAGQTDDPFETAAEKEYRSRNPQLVQPDSNYVRYWCSMEILSSTAENIHRLGLVEIANFLATFHPSCSAKVEFSEWSNEVLFKVLGTYPKETLQLINKNNSLYRGQIVQELRHPVNDLIDIPHLVLELNNVEDSVTLRTRNIILEQLPVK
jgi:hypothetical protein